MEPVLPNTPMRGWSILTTIENLIQQERPQCGGVSRQKSNHLARNGLAFLRKLSIAGGLEAAEARFWIQPHRVIRPSRVEVVRRMASRKPYEGPMTRTKSKPKTATRSRRVKTAKRKSLKRPEPVSTVSGALAKARAGTKNAQVVAMLQDRAGTTIAAIMAATGWQQHSVRGFLAGVVRKKLGLNLVSEPSESGRVYRIDDMASPAKANQVKQAA
jgi:hypothetical protein